MNGVVDGLKCSFNGHTPELCAKLHLSNTFAVVVEHLKRFYQARRFMDPCPSFRTGMVLIRSSINFLKNYANFVFQEIGMDEMEMMALSSAYDAMVDEFYWDLSDTVNDRIDGLVEHWIERKYRLRLPFVRMPRRDGTWNDPTGHELARETASCQPDANNNGHERYSEDVRTGDIFGNR